MIPRFTRIDADGVAETEAVSDAYLDMRDLGQVLAHIHDAEIEIGEGPGSPSREEPLQ
jgi:hypothetical protein